MGYTSALMDSPGLLDQVAALPTKEAQFTAFHTMCQVSVSDFRIATWDRSPGFVAIPMCKAQNETGGGVPLSWELLAFFAFSPSRLRGETSSFPASNCVSPLARIM